MGTGNLVNIAIVFEQLKGILSQLYVTGMVGQGFLRLSLEIRIMETLGNGQATSQEIHLLLIDFLGTSLGNDASGANVV